MKLKQLLKLATTSEQLDSLAKEAIKLAKSFDWKVLVKDWEKVIETVYNK